MSNTFYAKRGNKLLKIDEDNVERYLSQGYSITDVSGNLIKKGMPRDPNALSAEVKRQDAKIKELEAENARLLSELRATKAEIEKIKSAPISEPKPRKRKQATVEEAVEVTTE